MPTASPITNQTVGKTFTVAISALGVGAVLQLGLIAWAFTKRPPNATAGFAIPETPAIARLSAPPTVSPVATPDLTANPLPDAPPAPTGSAPRKPTPVPVKAPSSAEPVNRFEEVLLQGRQLRERGDMTTAITRFREAGAMDPKNPIAIAELAATYEKMSNADRAGEQWRKIYDMGDAAGVYFSLAEAKLKATQALAVQAATAGTAPPAPVSDGSVDTSLAVDGIAAGATLGLLPIRTEELSDDRSAKHFILHIPIKARPKAKTEVRDLVIHVLFYDIVDGQNVVQTSANVNSRWMAAPADWTEGDTEELAVEYQLDKPETKAAKREDRKYFGYIVRIYYKQELQAATAQPERLSQQYPPPPSLPKDPDK